MVKKDMQERLMPPLEKGVGFLRLTSRETQSPASQSQPSLKKLKHDGERRAIKEHAEAEKARQNREKEERKRAAAERAAAEREKAVRPFIAEIGEITGRYRGIFSSVARGLEERRIEAELRGMGAGAVIDEYHVNVARLADGDRKEREILQGALTWVRSAAKRKRSRPLLFARDIFSDRVEARIEQLLADGSYTREDTLDSRNGQRIPIKMSYKVRTVTGPTGNKYKMMVPEEYFQQPHFNDWHIHIQQTGPRYRAGYAIGFNEYGDIDNISDRYIHIGGERVEESAFRDRKGLNHGGEIHGSNGNKTRSFIKKNGADGEDFGNSYFFFEWDNLLTDPTFSVNTRLEEESRLDFTSNDIFALHPKANKGKGNFALSKKSKGPKYFRGNPTFLQVRGMLLESLRNLPVIPLAA